MIDKLSRLLKLMNLDRNEMTSKTLFNIKFAILFQSLILIFQFELNPFISITDKTSS